MRYGVRVVLRAADEIAHTDEVVEALLDALYDVDAWEDVDAVGSLSSRELELRLEVEADTLEEAQARVSSGIRDALGQIGDGTADPDMFRQTAVDTRELGLPA